MNRRCRVPERGHLVLLLSASAVLLLGLKVVETDAGEDRTLGTWYGLRWLARS